MAPEIGGEESLPAEGLRPPIKFFPINLKSDKPFDADKFDAMARGIGQNFSDPDLVKFLVLDDVMYVFNANVGSHKKLFEKLNRPDGQLQCAGYARVNDAARGRVIAIDADSLTENGLLGASESYEYSKTVLKPALAEFFYFISP